MGKEYEKQHIVPQSYLRHFADKKPNGKIYQIGVCLKNENSKVFISSVDNVGFIKNVYDDKRLADPKHWEHVYSQEFEPDYGAPLERIISKITMSVNDRHLLSHEDKLLIGRLIAIQVLRDPAFLDNLRQEAVEIGKNEAKEIRHKYEGQLSAGKRKIIDQYCLSINGLNSIMMSVATNKNKVIGIADIIAQRAMLVLYNKTTIPYCTSDNPVLFCTIQDKSFVLVKGGIARSNVHILYPISPSILIMASSCSWAPYSLPQKDGARIMVDSYDVNSVRSHNMLQYLHAHSMSFYPPAYIKEILSSITESTK